MEPETLFVGASSPVGKLGSAVAHAVYEGRDIQLRAIGAGAISQAVKAIAVARGYVAPRGADLLVRVGFADVTMPDKVVTAMTFQIIVR
jgi:stage V sporulation protein S